MSDDKKLKQYSITLEIFTGGDEEARVLADQVGIQIQGHVVAVLPVLFSRDDKTRAGRLANWWLGTAAADLERILPKAKEYSASDLDMMGDVLFRMLGLSVSSDLLYGGEIACMLYALGKICRALGAYREGNLPSDDTLLDASQYLMMARRIRAVGEWP